MRLTSHLDCAKPITEFGRKDAFVVDGPLGVCHDVVDVLRCRQPDLFALFVDPRVLSSKKKRERLESPTNRLCARVANSSFRTK